MGVVLRYQCCQFPFAITFEYESLYLFAMYERHLAPDTCSRVKSA
jgi:hypothetical protein